MLWKTEFAAAGESMSAEGCKEVPASDSFEQISFRFVSALRERDVVAILMEERCHESSFFKKVLEVCTGESDPGENNFSEIYIFSERLALGVYLKDSFTLVGIRLVDHDAAVESSGS